jgi:hypothetical protein
MHLIANLAAAAVVAAFGVAARVPMRLTLAWLVAWPITQVALLTRPELAHYGGLSGVLHAGVAVVSTWLLAAGGTRRRRTIGAVVLAGLVAKIAFERPWGPVLSVGGGWDIAVAPIAHLTGAAAGLACAAVALTLGTGPADSHGA